MALAAGLVLAASPVQAVNLLVNPSFETPPSGHLAYPPSYNGWTYFSPPEPPTYFGDYWIVGGNDSNDGIYPHSGNEIWKQWPAIGDPSTTNNVAGLYETFNSTPGNTYQASGWFNYWSSQSPGPNSYMWVQVEFLDSSSNLLALFKSANYSAPTATASTWVQLQATNVCDLTQPLTISPWFNTYAITGSVSQITAPSGTSFVRYRYCYLSAAGDGGSTFFDDADLEQLSGPLPLVISNVYPQNVIMVPPSSGFSFNVAPSGDVNSNAIHLILNGTDVSSSLTFSNFNGSWYANYNGLQSNSTYNASIYVTGSAATANSHFETTWYGVQAPSYVWEAEDWDFTNGLYYNNPDLCNAPGGANCYFGVVGVSNVDEYVTAPPPVQYYRGATDGIGTQPSGDYSRPNLFAASRVDYCINPFIGDPLYDSGSEWVNYTRDWPSSTNWIVGRFANGASSVGTVQMSVISGGVTNVVGTFTMNPYPANNPSYTTFQYVYLEQTNGSGQLASLVLNGKATLQMTSGGNMLPTFYMLVPAQPDLPFLSKLYPTGKHPFEPTNALSFTVTTGAGATFTASSVQVILDGNNVSSNLLITGSNLSNNVAYAALQPNAMHTVIINVTNSLGHGISLTNQFDTFSQSNYMFEAEDFDYNGGQYVPSASYTPDCYASFVSVTNVDFHHTYVSGEPTNGTEFNYRENGIPQQVDQDYLRQVYVNSFSSDYQLNWYGGGDWANYTRDYPLGTFNVYARTSGLGAFSMNFGQVVGGGGTTNQVVKPLGQFSSTLSGINTFGWVPLMDASGVVPVPVKITGVTTFQVLTPSGDCYPNFFMLVPTSTINVSAARSGNNINVTFPTQNGWGYRVFYRTNLTTGSWTLLNSIAGNGSVESVTDTSPGDNQRFYKVTSP